MPNPPEDPNAFEPHVSRLRWVWVRDPVYFITTCTAGRRCGLDDATVAACFRAEWLAA